MTGGDDANAALIHGVDDTLSTYLPQIVPFTTSVQLEFVSVGGVGLLLSRQLARRQRIDTDE